MKKFFYLMVILMAAAIIAIFTLVDTREVHQATVKDVIENAVALDKSDVTVVLSGTVSSQISKKKFWFEDQTGQIVIEVKNSLLNLVPSTNTIKVEIRGEVDCETNAGEGVKINVEELVFDDDDDVQIM